ncbi:hypothetical protein McanCB56680_005493 [Microsporum canis]
MSPLGSGRRGLRSQLFDILSTIAPVDSVRRPQTISIARKQLSSLSPSPKYASTVSSCHNESKSELSSPRQPHDAGIRGSKISSRRNSSSQRRELDDRRHHKDNGTHIMPQQPQPRAKHMPKCAEVHVPCPNQRLTTSRSVEPPINAPLRYLKGYNLSRPQRRELRAAIESECAEIRSSTDRDVYSDEYLVREMSLYPLSQIHPKWKQNLKTLYANKRNNVPVSETWKMLSTEDSDIVPGWIKGILGSPRTAPPPSTRWRRLCRNEAARRWPLMILWLLLHSPLRALRFLEATTTRFSPSFPMVADCFIYLETFHIADFLSSPKSKKRYIHTLRHCLRPEVLPHLSMGSQSGFRLYLKYCESHILLKGFKHVIKRQKFLSLETLLCFTDLFTKQGNIPEALNSLRLLMTRFEPQKYHKSPTVTDRCCNLLKLDRYTRKDDGNITFEILPQILQMGVQPDLSIYNIVVSNASKSDDLDTALQIVQLMESQGVTPDSHTYLLILHNAVRLRDYEKVDHILHKITKVKTLSTHPHIVSKTLHAILLLPNSTGPGQKGAMETFHKMLNVYKRAHQLQPLVDLGLVPYSQNDQVLSASKSPPSNQSLGIMITAYLRTQPDPDKVWEYFTRFQKLVASGHPLITPLVSTDYVFNSFLMALRFESRMIPNCFMLLKYMLQPLSETALYVARGQGCDPLSPLPAQPSKRTWTILLNTLISHNQIEAAEKLHQTMKDRGVEINDVSWNTLIRGYASNQMVEAAAKALKEMERQSWSPDGHTVKALGFIENQELLRTILDHLDSESELEKGKSAVEEC